MSVARPHVLAGAGGPLADTLGPVAAAAWGIGFAAVAMLADSGEPSENNETDEGEDPTGAVDDEVGRRSMTPAKDPTKRANTDNNRGLKEPSGP